MSVTDKELEKIPGLFKKADEKLKEFVGALVELEKVLDETGLDGPMDENLEYALALITNSGEQIEFNYCGITLPHTYALFAEEIAWEYLRENKETKQMGLCIGDGYNKEKESYFVDKKIPFDEIKSIEIIHIRKGHLE